MTVAGTEDCEPAPEEGEEESTLDDPPLTAELPAVPLVGAAEEGTPESVLDKVGFVEARMTVVEADDPPPIGTRMTVLEPAVAGIAWLALGTVAWLEPEVGGGLLDWVATETCVLAKPTKVVGTKEDSPWDEPALVEVGVVCSVATATVDSAEDVKVDCLWVMGSTTTEVCAAEV